MLRLQTAVSKIIYFRFMCLSLEFPVDWWIDGYFFMDDFPKTKWKMYVYVQYIYSMSV